MEVRAASLNAADWHIMRGDPTLARLQLGVRRPKAEIRGRTILELAKDTLAIAHQGLARRGHKDASGRDETRFLEPLDDSVTRAITPAEELLAQYHGAWGGAVDPVYTEYAY